MDYLKRKWDSLRSLKETIENDKTETVISFNGWQLVTNKATYGLCDRVLSRVATNDFLDLKKIKTIKKRK
jgi:hypothetical protein